MMCLPWGIKLDEGQAFTHDLIKVAFAEDHHLGLGKDRGKCTLFNIPTTHKHEMKTCIANAFLLANDNRKMLHGLFTIEMLLVLARKDGHSIYTPNSFLLKEKFPARAELN